MPDLQSAAIALDYGDAATDDLLKNLSGVAGDSERLWTVSDEGRTVECLRAAGAGFVLAEQIPLDDWCDDIPGAGKSAECDLESIDLVGDRLWVCGSHCLVRRKPKAAGLLNDSIRARPSRNILAALDLGPDHQPRSNAVLPFDRKGSLRHALKDDPYLAPFLDLPSKENGLDIEGMAVVDGRVFLGLRGPLLDSFAVIVTLDLSPRFHLRGYELSFLDLNGLAVRDLARWGNDLLILAGPVSDAHGMFRLYLWSPRSCTSIQTPTRLFSWPDSEEKPEGICPLLRDGERGLLVLYDRPDVEKRIRETVYLADWLTGL
ncbi:DUF3616 domain-containing protein [Jiella sp. M17.18]|uniref:DUF3616 domain-containing protein n=1 Tax=Jiella sp. M17.18 TaxID=3234247 RepID=UPI0034DF0B7F